ncbi:MAG: NlpC/P60 family protein [Oribacterium sp.]|nr:NlpC/P60 family protein [Oribacterium sp.]
MAELKPEQIIEDATYALNNGWGYIRGKTGQVWTENDQTKAEADPNGREQTRLYGRTWIGRRVVDGPGLISWIFYRHGSYMPHGCNSIYNRFCEPKGELKDGNVLKPGCLVFKRSDKYENPIYHVGVYVGEGRVIEAHGTAKGVIQSTLFGWSHYGYPKNVKW